MMKLKTNKISTKESRPKIIYIKIGIKVEKSTIKNVKLQFFRERRKKRWGNVH